MPGPLFFDVHTHTHFAAFDGDTGAVIGRALDNGVWMINVGTQKDTSRRAVEIAESYGEGVYAAVGLHPIHTEKSHHDKKELGAVENEAGEGFVSRGEDFDFGYYKQLALHPKVVAIGECGLDYYRLSDDTKRRQQKTFEQHIKLAAEVTKPLMIHCRNAFVDLIKFLQATLLQKSLGGQASDELQSNQGIVHFFTGSMDDARKLLDLGFSFSFGGVLTFTRDYDELVRFIPIDRIISETDAPYVTPVPYRGKRNEPLYVREVVEKIAEIKGEEFEKTREILSANAMRIFNIKTLLTFHN